MSEFREWLGLGCEYLDIPMSEIERLLQCFDDAKFVFGCDRNAVLDDEKWGLEIRDA